MDNRAEVREFLTSRRAKITPEQARLPTAGRRVPGLRRGEVAQLAGLSLDDIVKLTIYLTDPADFGDFTAVAGEMMPAPTSAITALVVPFLTSPEQRVEIEAIAAS